MSNADTTYYIRVRGKILGPYNVTQLKTLRGRGQFSRANEVSTDRQTWQSAAIIEHLFGGVIKQAKPAPDEAPASVPGGSPPSRKVNPIWHYSVGSDQYGPVTLLELRGLVNSGQLTADDLVWKEGLPDWTPVSDIGELNVAARPSLSALPSPQFSGSGALQNFCYACGSPMDARAEVCPKCGVRQTRGTGSGEKDRITAALLAFFLGGIGVHHFYLGNTAAGVIYLLFCWTLIPAIIAFIEFIIFLCMSDASFAAKYAPRG